MLFVVLGLAAAGLVANARAQHFDQLTRPVASVDQAALIDTLLGDLLILVPDTARVARVDVVDLTANGYGPDDVLIVYPTLATYLLRDDVPARVQQIMKRWELEADYRLDASLAESAKVEDEAHRRRSAPDALSGALINAVSRYYHAADIDLRLSRDSTGLRLEMWNFDPGAMQYVPPPEEPACVPSERTPTVPVALRQMFRFRLPHLVAAFRDPGACVLTSIEGGVLHTRPCPP